MKYFSVASVLLALSPGQGLLAADKAPEFKIESCRAAEEASVGRNGQQCFDDEQKAKDTLQQNWTGYDFGQKGHCQRLLKAGGSPSYVELLTCLEMKTGPATMPTGNSSKNRGGAGLLRQ